MYKLELYTNLYVKEDGYDKAYPVRIFDGNIIPTSSKGLPFTEDESVNFKFDYAPRYAENSNQKVNTRFLYPYSRNYIKAGTEGRFEAYAKLKWLQRSKLSCINNSSFIQREKKFIITIVVGLLASIPLWIPLFRSESSTNNQLQNTSSQREIINNQADIDTSQLPPLDTLQMKKSK